ncbi:hypothetical protein Trydic_g9466 [Trypoxylus dichotomus]
MDKLAESLYEAHQHPIVKSHVTGNKLYLPKNSEEEQALVNNNIQLFKKTLDFPRVDRRCGRSLAVWLEDKHLANVIKKHYQNYGFQDKTGTYLYPEEALFLLETNRLEMQWKDIPLSIQQGYALIINEDILPLEKYKVYKKLALQGHKISKSDKPTYYDDEPEQKRIKLTNRNSYEVAACSSGNKGFSQKYDYKISDPKMKETYNIHIVQNGELDPRMCLLENGAYNLYAFSFPDDVAFYKFAKIEIPDITNEDFS